MATGQLLHSDSWSEEDVELAERYAAALKQISELSGDWSDDDVQTAENYAATLQGIEQLRQ